MVLEYLYDRNLAPEYMRRMMQEFYGREFAFFKAEDANSLQEFVSKHPERKEGVLENLKRVILKQADKGLLSLGFTHKLLHEFFSVAPDKVGAAQAPRRVPGLTARACRTFCKWCHLCATLCQ